MNRTWKGKARMIKKPVLADLKPPSGLNKSENCEESQSAHVAKLEKLAADQLEEICELRRQLHEEKSKNEKLEKKVQEMTQFLEDYGLQWVGGLPPALEEYAKGPEKYVFMRKVEELNSLTENNNKMEFEKTGNVAVLKVQKAVSIILFNDGFTVNDGELRPYNTPSSASFMRDILDGFFPQEFKQDYPDGVKLKVEDRRTRQNDDKPDDLEMLPAPTGIGEGDGAVKVRIPAIPDVTIKITKTQTVQDLMNLIEHNFDIRNFALCSPMSSEPLQPDRTVGDVGLYPKGMALVLFP